MPTGQRSCPITLHMYLSRDPFAILILLDLTKQAYSQRERFGGHDTDPYRVSHASRDRESARFSLTIPQ